MRMKSGPTYESIGPADLGLSFKQPERPLNKFRNVGVWFSGLAAMTSAVVVVGGVTRLTESGLSMTSWHFIKDMKWPDSDEAWAQKFEEYKEFPEYKEINRDMTVEGFKNIYYWEYTHRSIARATGFVYLIPLIIFRKQIPRTLYPRILATGALLAFQGGLGWYMVRSGLEEHPEDLNAVPRVSQYRLAAHYTTAVVILLSSVSIALTCLRPFPKPHLHKNLPRLRTALTHTRNLAFVTAVSGAFVAGLDAGMIYNTFPMMADRWIPTDLLSLEPTFRNFTENPTTAQFQHRILGITTATSVFLCGLLARPIPLRPNALWALRIVMATATAQVALGIATLLYFVPVPLAAAHQAGSITLLSALTWIVHELKIVPK